MTQTALMDRIRATSHAITCQVAGELVAWHVKPAQKIDRWETVATVRDQAGIVEITTEQPGTIKALMLPIGSHVAAGEVVAYFQPDKAPRRAAAAPDKPYSGPYSGLKAPFPSMPPAEETPPVAPHSAPQSEFKPPAPRRRGTLPAAADLARVEVEELAIAPESGAIVPPEPIGSLAKASKPQKRTRTAHATYHITTEQKDGLKKLAASLTLKDVSCSESELVRAAVQLLLDLPEPALLALVEKNQAREKAGKYGRGWPRPRGK